MKKTQIREKLFWNKVDNSGKCWEWTACLSTTGYGRFGNSRKTYYAHRVSYAWYNGKLLRKEVVRHKCDNPKCVRPSHLIKGMQIDNVRDMINRNRDVREIKVSDKSIIKIRKLKSLGMTTKELGDKYKLSVQHINAICRGAYRKDVGGPIEKRFLIDRDMVIRTKKLLRTSTVANCAEVLGISKASVQMIKNGKKDHLIV